MTCPQLSVELVNKKKIRQQYHDYEQSARRLQRNVVGQIEHLLSENEISLGVPLETRIKALSSINEKIERKTMVVNDVRDLDDLVGFRLIPMFKRDTDTVCKLLRDTFSVISDEDTGSRLDETQFGYQSRHLVIRIPDDWFKIPTFAGLEGFKCEIQVRSLAQHIWAAASHKLQYKREASVPPPLRRTINRISALLETVDLEFERVLSERDAYLSDATALASADEILNVDILETILNDILPPQNKDAGEQYDKLLVDLNHFKIGSTKQLRDLFGDHYQGMMKSEANEISTRLNEDSDDDTDEDEIARIKAGVFFTHVGLTREALRMKFGDGAVDKYFTSKIK